MIIFSHSKDGELIKTKTSLFFYLNNYVYHFSKPSGAQLSAKLKSEEKKSKKPSKRKSRAPRHRK